jgi:ribosomal protein L21E
VKFLQEYECERYYEYNQNLIFSTEEDAVREAIADRRYMKEIYMSPAHAKPKRCVQ